MVTRWAILGAKPTILAEDWQDPQAKADGITMLRYVSEYSNQVHQLLVSVSRHLWVTRDGRIQYQRKAFEVSLEKLPGAPKRHIVHYLVRDHFSGLVYAELAISPDLPDPREFLTRAWSRKDALSFCGIPAYLTLPGTVDRRFCELRPWLHELSVDVIKASSGFQAGVRDLKTWEDEVRYALWWYPANDLRHLPALAESMCLDISERAEDGPKPADRWREDLRELRFPRFENPLLQLVPDEARSRLREQRSAAMRNLTMPRLRD